MRTTDIAATRITPVGDMVRQEEGVAVHATPF
jgi:hypothetical protein